MTRPDRWTLTGLTVAAALTAAGAAWLRWDNRRTVDTYRAWNQRMDTR